jgi:NAD(P)-dependent dehydrogenase (short-subunit alcohol dehydrogenase family)
MDLKLEGKRAFISGSTQGIGFAIAERLLMEGAEVIINGRSRKKTEAAAEKLKFKFPNSVVTGISTDFLNFTEVKLLADRLECVDILINNVGIFELKELKDITEEDWDRFFQVNFMSAIRLSTKLLPKMMEQNWGRIIFISSESGINVPANMIHYGATKAALMAFGNGLSKLTKGTDLTVNTILGGPTYSDGVSQTIVEIASAQNIPVNQLKQAIIDQTNPESLLGRFIEPTEIANLTAYLASPLSSATNGACLRADGGVLQTV